ncbi:amino acid ABC transporter permease [Trinickia symbiotica]|uniref:Amino acid ABC transporter permease n=1 Tax=Trinickia symbiotica TaxID=863227 RepID=A0A2T3XWT1_9BURK|nr:amino acid ABC transporter permease [Trinickia symbiotica]PTB20969.1 amino acid ABC transporter permease [Trinickia symbiotica]
MSGWLAPTYVGWIAHGYAVTLALAASVIVAATFLGFVLALVRSTDSALARRTASTYVTLVRNSPLIVQLLFWYYGAAMLLPSGLTSWLNVPHRFAVGPLSIAWPSFEVVAGFIGLTLYTTTFVGEELRAGLAGVPKAQREAAAALGLARVAAFRHVVLPQAIRIAVPALVGQYMNVVKNSSLTMAIGVAELSYASREVDSATFKTFQAYGSATILYIVTIAVIEAVFIAYRRGSLVADRRGIAR